MEAHSVPLFLTSLSLFAMERSALGNEDRSMIVHSTSVQATDKSRAATNQTTMSDAQALRVHQQDHPAYERRARMRRSWQRCVSISPRVALCVVCARARAPLRLFLASRVTLTVKRRARARAELCRLSCSATEEELMQARPSQSTYIVVEEHPHQNRIGTWPLRPH